MDWRDASWDSHRMTVRGDAGQQGYCGQCDMIVPEGPDACMGWLEGVRSACCGHGDDDYAFVVLNNGVTLRGQGALDWAASAPVLDANPYPFYCDNCGTEIGAVASADGERILCAPCGRSVVRAFIPRTQAEVDDHAYFDALFGGLD